jgi:hypothetical protein
MMVQGIVRKLHSLKQLAILLKLDITKVFNTVDWSFLLEVLRKMGVGARLLACICALLSTASTHVLVNGSPRARVANMCGLRQGDPLSPQVFILAMEVLHFALEKATQEGHLAPLTTTGLRQHTLFMRMTWSPLSIRVWEILGDLLRSLRILELHPACAPTSEVLCSLDQVSGGGSSPCGSDPWGALFYHSRFDTSAFH